MKGCLTVHFDEERRIVRAIVYGMIQSVPSNRLRRVIDEIPSWVRPMTVAFRTPNGWTHHINSRLSLSSSTTDWDGIHW